MDEKYVEGRLILEEVDPIIFGACDTVLNLLHKLYYSEEDSDMCINDIKFCREIYNKFRKQSVQADVLSFFEVTVVYSESGIASKLEKMLKNLDFLDIPANIDMNKVMFNDAKYLNQYIEQVLNISKNSSNGSSLNRKQISVLEGWLVAYSTE